MIKPGTVAILAALSTAGGLAAQQHPHGQAPDTTGEGQQAQAPGRMGMLQGGMMAGHGMVLMPAHDLMQRAMRLSPARLLEHRDDLGLTPEQTNGLEGLATRDSPVAQGRMAAVKQAADELTRLFDAAKPDTAAVRAAAERLVARHGAVRAERLAAAAAVRSLLSAAQLQKAMLLGRCDMHFMMGGMMQEGGMTRGMMRRERPDSPSEHDRHHQPPQDGS